MMKNEEKLPYFAWKTSILTRAIDKYGRDKQIDMLIEECGELIVALQHLKRGRVTWTEVSEEMADVTIMIDQMKTMGVVDQIVNGLMDYKLKRLEERLIEADKNGN